MKMFKNNILLLLTLLLTTGAFSQVKKNARVGIGTTDPKKTLHVEGNMRVEKLADKTEEKEYDNVLLMRTTTKTHTYTNSSGEVVEAGRGDIYRVPRRVFRNYDNIDIVAQSRLLIYQNVGENPVSTASLEAMREASHMKFEVGEFRIEKGKKGSYQFQFRPNFFAKFPERVLDYGLENRAAAFHVGTSNNGSQGGEWRSGYPFYYSQDASSTLPYRNLLKGINTQVRNSPISEYIVFNFGFPFASDNPFQSIYRIRMNTLGGPPTYGLGTALDQPKDINLSNNNAYMVYTIQELANTSDDKTKKTDLSKRFSLWLTGAFVGRNGRAWAPSWSETKNKQYPTCMEIYIPDPNALTWDDARHFEVRFGKGEPRPLFISSTQFNFLINSLRSGNSGVGNFIYLYYADNNAFDKLFPPSTYGPMASSNSLVYNLKPYRNEYEYIAGTRSIIIYYRGHVVDAIGDGLYQYSSGVRQLVTGAGETLRGGTLGYPVYGSIDYTFAWGGWIKRKPHTNPEATEGLFKAEDWYRPAGQEDESKRPLKYDSNNNEEGRFPFPVGNRPSSGKPGSPWAGQHYRSSIDKGYVYP